MKIIDLESPYKELAIKRSIQEGFKMEEIENGLTLNDSFSWWHSKEGYDFWGQVNKGNYLEIKDTKLLAELTKMDTIISEISNYIDKLYDMDYMTGGKAELLEEIKEILKKHI